MTFFLEKKYQLISDEELMRLVIKGKEKAFDELYKRYAKKLLYFFFQKLKNEDKANDFLQDLFLKLIECPEKFDVSKKFSSWIYSVAHNMCKNEYRTIEKNIERNNLLNIEEENLTIPYFCSIDFETFYNTLQNELAKIDESHRLTFELRYFHDLSLNEIAEITTSSVGTVKSRLFYTSKKLAKSLEFLNEKI